MFGSAGVSSAVCAGLVAFSTLNISPCHSFSFTCIAVIVVGAVLWSSCGNSDEAEELSGGYLYRDEGGNIKELLSGRAGMVSIHGKVVRYRYNAEFIAAVQHPVYEEYRTGLGFDLRDDERKFPTNSAAEQAASERVADSLLTHDPKYRALFIHKTNYWIIAHHPGKVYGPLTYPQYVQQAQSLQVPNRLMLEVEPE